jgi:hypothetical protein
LDNFVGTFLFPFLEILELKKSRDQLVPQRMHANTSFRVTGPSKPKVPNHPKMTIENGLQPPIFIDETGVNPSKAPTNRPFFIE